MKHINIERARIISLPILKTKSLHCESDIYYDRSKLYKILEPQLRDREPIVEELHDAKIPNTAVPREKITSNSFLSSHFLGYTMDYYKDYDELFTLLDKDLPLEKRKRIIRKINRTYRNIQDLGYRYWDMRQGNIITDGKDIIYVDMDSVKRIFDRSVYSDMFARERLFTMSLSLLLNREHGSIIYSSGNKSGLSNLSQEKLYEFIETLTPDKDIRAILKSIYSVLMRNSIKMNGISDIELANFLASSCYFDEILDSFSESSISESLRVLK